ncbi:MAG: hypothetical protein PQJ61_16125 [Spirochaetales bacterium]|uniref:Uncharacterized protein n=1 Tax=Candidatus Thalassospirochaeta sargassi TaxID=3119039 RepID=A0AAJ1MNV3_9SPIO|nr:hypothetical protein [Spirochaetales bacterium]
MFGLNKEKNKIDGLLKDIRADYETLVGTYSRPRSLSKQFEMRYRDAVEYRLNLVGFLEAEKEAVKALLGQAENNIQDDPPQASTPASKHSRAVDRPRSAKVDDGEERISFADRLIQEFAERIKKYPEIIIHPDAAFEMKKLFGALSCVEKDYWGTVDRIIRNMYGSKRFRDSVDIEPEINRMCTPGIDGLPPALGTYHRLLERMPRDYREVEREEQRCLVNAAVLLKRMQAEVIRSLDVGSSLDEEERTRLSEAKVYIDSMIEDFRLKDLGRLN